MDIFYGSVEVDKVDILNDIADRQFRRITIADSKANTESFLH